MKNGNHNKVLNRAMIVLLVLSILCALTATTYAWLRQNRVVDNNEGMALKARNYSDMTTVICHALKYDGIQKASATLIDEDGELIVMSEYDRVFTDRNVNTPMIVRIMMNIPEEFDADTPGHLIINVPCVDEYLDGVHIGNSLSNVITVKAGLGLTTSQTLDTVGSTDAAVQAAKVDLYQGAVASLKAHPSASDSFVKVASGSFMDFEKVNNLTLTVPYSDYVGHIQGSGAQRYIILYVEFDYDDTLIDNYMTCYETVPDDLKTDFLPDVGIIYLEWEADETT